MAATPSAAATFSKLPIRQVTVENPTGRDMKISKLPIRQVTDGQERRKQSMFSKLPIRQVTLPE